MVCLIKYTKMKNYRQNYQSSVLFLGGADTEHRQGDLLGWRWQISAVSYEQRKLAMLVG